MAGLSQTEMVMQLIQSEHDDQAKAEYLRMLPTATEGWSADQIVQILGVFTRDDWTSNAIHYLCDKGYIPARLDNERCYAILRHFKRLDWRDSVMRKLLPKLTHPDGMALLVLFSERHDWMDTVLRVLLDKIPTFRPDYDTILNLFEGRQDWQLSALKVLLKHIPVTWANGVSLIQKHFTRGDWRPQAMKALMEAQTRIVDPDRKEDKDAEIEAAIAKADADIRKADLDIAKAADWIKMASEKTPAAKLGPLFRAFPSLGKSLLSPNGMPPPDDPFWQPVIQPKADDKKKGAAEVKDKDKEKDKDKDKEKKEEDSLKVPDDAQDKQAPDDGPSCAICLENIPQVVLSCGHRYLCFTCARIPANLKECAKCRKPVTSIVCQIFDE